MNSKLLAFQVARPIEAMSDDLTEYSYDPRTQTAVWNGTGRAAAAYLYCTGGGGYTGCNGYAYYCTTWGKSSKTGQHCD
jgi:hypothetical protein